MSIVDNILERISQIIDASRNAYVYTAECALIDKFLNELISKMRTIKYNSTDDSTYFQLLEKLNFLYQTVDIFEKEKWLNICFKIKITDPFELIEETMNSITKILEGINIEIDNKYEVLPENAINELKALYGIYSDMQSQQDDRKIRKKLRHIEKYLSEKGQSLPETASSSRKKHKKSKKHSKDSSQETNDKDLSQETDEKDSNQEEEKNSEKKSIKEKVEYDFNDFSNIQSYKIKQSDFIQEPSPVTDNISYSIYRGKLKSTNEDINIIILRKIENPEEKFRRLVNVLITAQSPNLETFVGAVDHAPPYIVVTRREGKILRDVLQQKKRKKKSSTSNESESNSIYKNGNRTIIAFKIASAMAHLHSLNIIHRDLCCSNITIDENFNPKIINFVNSRFLPQDIEALSYNRFQSDSFIAPELFFEDDNYDEKVDVFAFGGLLFELLTGKQPFCCLSPNEVEEEIKSQKRPELPFDISDDLKELIEKCWSTENLQRPSFVNIIDKMLEKKISFPSDEEYAKKFYALKSVKNSRLNDCFKLFKSISSSIKNSCLYEQEILRIQSLLNAYQFALFESKLRTQDQFEEADSVNITKICLALGKIKNMILQSNENKLTDLSTEDPESFIPLALYKAMEELYVSMTLLGFKVSKYEIVNSDLLTDLRSIYRTLVDNYNEEEDMDDDEIYVNNLKEKMNKIDDFLKQRGLNLEISNEEVNNYLSKSLSYFNKFSVDRKDYRIKKKIGQGFSSTVYKAKQKSTGNYVAVKEFNDDYLQNFRYLRREVCSLAHLKHKYLIKFVGFNNEESEKLWIITELVTGGELFEANTKGKLTPFQKTKIAFEIAEGMEYLHKKRFIHRDLKTSNILLKGDTPIITDFGYSRFAISSTMSNKIGTINYMSPEIIENDQYSFETDVFSYGLLLWELYSVEVPYSWCMDIEDAIVGDEPLSYESPISQDLKDLIEDSKSYEADQRPTFTQIIERMIDKNIHFEYADMNEVKEFYQMKKIEREKEREK